MNKYVIGMDFGTLSARAVLLNLCDGKMVNESVFEYPHGVITGKLENGFPLPNDYALADSRDYSEALYSLIRNVSAPIDDKKEIVGIGIAATSFTMVPCFSDGTVLCEESRFSYRPMAYIKLWKHHGAESQAKKIMDINGKTGGLPVLSRYGYVCNCEWCLPKLLETFETDREVFDSTYRFCDLGEWLSWLLTGSPISSVYSLGFKAAWAEDIGFPDKGFLDVLGQGFGDGYLKKVAGTPSRFDTPCGYLSQAAAEKTGLPAGIPIATPVGDGSSPFITFNYSHPNSIAITIGTSIAMAFLRKDQKAISGINGVSDDGFKNSGYYLYDAGQPCAGDMLDWFVRNQVPERYYKEAEIRNMNIHSYLSELAAGSSPERSKLTVLDWFNGNRSILNDASLRGCIFGLSMDTKPEELYCAMIQGMACGTKKILLHFIENGIEFDQIILCGGIVEKNPFIRQQYANILGREILFSNQDRITARSAGILAAIASGMDKESAINTLTTQEFLSIKPDSGSEECYQIIFDRWNYYHDLIGYAK